MSENDKAIIDEIYVAFNSRNYEDILGHFTEGFEWIAAENSPLADLSPYRGIDAIRTGVFDRIAAGFESLTVKADEIFAGEDRVVVLGYYHGKFRGRSDEFRAQVAHIWTVGDGKAKRFQQYVDTLKIARDASS
ncbi:MAG: nuclear transport factor 2 family protein [Acidobacteriota bacterium]